MAENEQFFTPESVDEQVKRLSAQHDNTSSPQDEVSKHLIKDLHQSYHTQAEQSQQTLDRAWQRIQQRNRVVERPTEPLPLIQSVQETRRRGRRSNGWTGSRQFSMIAAVLVICLLVGSLLVVLNIAQKNTGNPAGKTATSTPAVPTLVAPTITGGTLFTRQDRSAIYSVDWSPDGTLIAAASKTVQIWDAKTGKQKLTLTPSQVHGPFAARWSPDGKSLATATSVLQIWTSTGQLMNTCPDPMQRAANSTSAMAIALFSPRSGSGTLGYTSASDTSLSNAGQEPVNVSWSPDSKLIAFTYRNQASPMIVVVNSATCEVKEAHNYHKEDIPYDVSWSPDGKYLAVATSDRSVQVLELGKKGEPVYTFHDPSKTNVFSIAWSPDSKSIASTSYGSRKIRVWNALNGKIEHEYKDSTGSVTRLAWLHNSNKIASVSEPPEEGDSNNGKIQIWNVDTLKTLYTYPDHTRPVLALAWSPDGKWIASTDGDPDATSNAMGNGTLKVWLAP